MIPNWINLDITTKCTLQCPQCTRTTFYNGRPPGSNMTFNQFEKILDYFSVLVFCGQISDPVYHPNFIEFLKMINNKNKMAVVNTAASHRSVEWYKQAFEANKEAWWRFGIDGLPQDSHKYRVNQDGEKLFEMMLMAKKMGLRVEWQVLVFDYVSEKIDQIKQLAAKHDLQIAFEQPRNSKI